MLPLDTPISPTPTLPETAPFTPEQRAWLDGYVAGLLSADRVVAPATATKSLLIFFGSQTGTSETLARRFAHEAKPHGFEVRVVGMENFATIDFKTESRLALVTSTYGEGEMPDNAQAFWNFLQTETAPRLEGIEFSVLALGDTSYAQFCQAGKLLDQRLEQLGAKRAYARVDCDVDYEAKAKAWFEAVMGAWSGEGAGGPASPVTKVEAMRPLDAPKAHSKSNPFPARVKTNRKLNAEGSAKEVRHFEIMLEGSGLHYEVGDALGVVPTNCSEFVQEILDAAGLDGEESVATPSGIEKPLRLALQHDFELRPFCAALPASGISASELVAKTRKLQPRLYSIASSLKAHPDEVHLTVGVVRYEHSGRSRKGACSTFLADRVGPDHSVPVFVHATPGFKPPKDSAMPMIMVGPGTGIAPFRAFLQERRAVGATGRNWLFFGDQQAATDFLYRDVLEAWKNEGHLNRLDTAFSRDQSDKIYVQHRMLENGNELWNWLEQGAHFYVCGDASRMAKDVDAALHKICETAGGLSVEAATEYVKNLKTQKRYCRDVY